MSLLSLHFNIMRWGQFTSNVTINESAYFLTTFLTNTCIHIKIATKCAGRCVEVTSSTQSSNFTTALCDRNFVYNQYTHWKHVKFYLSAFMWTIHWYALNRTYKMLMANEITFDTRSSKIKCNTHGAREENFHKTWHTASIPIGISMYIHCCSHETWW